MAAPALGAAKKPASRGRLEDGLDDAGELLLETVDLTTKEDLSRVLARRLIERVGLRVAAEQIGIKPDALARFVAGAKSHRGTVKLVEDGLKRGEK
jgi:hypothetical protein